MDIQRSLERKAVPAAYRCQQGNMRICLALSFTSNLGDILAQLCKQVPDESLRPLMSVQRSGMRPGFFKLRDGLEVVSFKEAIKSLPLNTSRTCINTFLEC